jgi:hypothetical protein
MNAPTYSRAAFLNALREAVTLSDAAVRLALVLDGYADREGKCWPSQRRLAEVLAWSLRKVERTMRELVEAGVVVYVKRARHRGERSLIRLVEISTTTATGDGGSRSGTTVTDGAEPPSQMPRTTVTDGGRNQPKNQSIEPTQKIGGEVLSNPAVRTLPSRVRRDIENASPTSKQKLTESLAEAAAAGVSSSQLKRLWDVPGPLDAPDVKDPAAIYASRIRKFIKQTTEAGAA